MRFPRWLVVSLLSVSLLAVPSAGAWWWVTWPERTVRKFDDFVRSGLLREAVRMLATPVPTELAKAVAEADGTPNMRLMPPSQWRVSRPRALADVFAGRLQFQLVFNEELDWREDYIAERGKVFRR
jgi:hypothetical protein